MSPSATLRATVVVLLNFMQLWLFGCATQRHQSYRPGPAELLQASKRAGVEVRPEEIFSMSLGTEILVTAPIVSWEQTPSTDLRRGVNIAFAYFDTQMPNVPKGYYTLKAFADVTHVGNFDATIQLIDEAGRVVAKLPAEARIHSLTLPEGAASRPAFVTAVDEGAARKVWYRCLSNGSCLLMHVIKEHLFD